MVGITESSNLTRETATFPCPQVVSLWVLLLGTYTHNTCILSQPHGPAEVENSTHANKQWKIHAFIQYESLQ